MIIYWSILILIKAHSGELTKAANSGWLPRNNVVSDSFSCPLVSFAFPIPVTAKVSWKLVFWFDRLSIRKATPGVSVILEYFFVPRLVAIIIWFRSSVQA